MARGADVGVQRALHARQPTTPGVGEADQVRGRYAERIGAPVLVLEIDARQGQVVHLLALGRRQAADDEGALLALDGLAQALRRDLGQDALDGAAGLGRLPYL